MTVYALGTGKNPFQDISEYEVREVAKRGTRPSRHYIDGKVFLGGLAKVEIEQLEALMTRMWHENPELRPSVLESRMEVARNGLIPNSSITAGGVRGSYD